MISDLIAIPATGRTAYRASRASRPALEALIPGPAVQGEAAWPGCPHRGGRGRPTMKDVANRAGVALKTVSRVVNDEPG